MCLGTSTDVLSTTSRMFILLLSCFLLAGAKAQDDSELFPEEYVVKYEVCSTEACNATAHEILSGMDENVEPCMDFYNFACKNWRNSNPDIAGLPVRTQFTNAELNFKQKMKRTLETTSETRESEGFQIAKELYNACMNNDTREEQLSYLRDIVRGAGNWLLADPQAVLPKSVEQMDQYLTKEFGISWIYNISYIMSSSGQSNRYNLMIKPTKTSRPPFAHGSMQVKKKYAAFAGRVVRMFIGEKKYSALSKDHLDEKIDEMLQFEEAVVQAHALESTLSQCELLGQSLSNMEELFSGAGKDRVDWETRLKPLLPPQKDHKVVVACPSQLLKVIDLITHYDSDTIKNYIIWNFLMHVLPMIDTDLRNIVYPENADKPRWQQCLEENDALTAVYYHILKKDAEERNDKQALDIYDVMEGVTAWRLLGLKDRLRGTNVRLHAYQLHQKMATHFKNSEPYFSPMEYQKHFPRVNASQLYSKNILTKAKFHYEKIAVLLAMPFDPKNWHEDIHFPSNIVHLFPVFDILQWYALRFRPEYQVTPFTVHVQGKAFNKARYVPAAALEMPFYHKDRPQSLNYGALGSIFGKSFMTEYYGYLIASYQGNGKIDSFPETSMEAFKENGQYVLQHWNGYPLKKKLSKDVIDMENLHQLYSHHAQSDAVTAAFEAYEREFKLRRWKDLRLPGLEKYDHKQLFFLSYANAHCVAPSRIGMTKIEQISQAVVAEMDMEERRKVIVSLIQTQQFADAFKCKDGTWMNPRATKRYW